MMKKYVCTICGYVYDEEAEGVRWEELPEDWVCPLCAVGKDQFEEQA
jgi:rubredoxin